MKNFFPYFSYTPLRTDQLDRYNFQSRDDKRHFWDKNTFCRSFLHRILEGILDGIRIKILNTVEEFLSFQFVNSNKVPSLQLLRFLSPCFCCDLLVKIVIQLNMPPSLISPSLY